MSLPAVSTQTSAPTETGKIDPQQPLTKQGPSTKAASKTTDSLEQPTQRHCIVRLALSILRTLEKIPSLGRFFKWLAEKLDPKGGTQGDASTGGATTPPPPTPSFLFTQKYAEAFKTNLLKLAQEHKVSDPEAQKATTALVEAFVSYHGAKEAFFDFCNDLLNVDDNENLYKPLKEVLQEQEALKKDFQDKETRLDAALVILMLAAHYSRALQNQSAHSAQDFLAWAKKLVKYHEDGDKIEIRNSLNKPNYFQQIKHLINSNVSQKTLEDRMSTLFSPTPRVRLDEPYNKKLAIAMCAISAYDFLANSGELPCIPSAPKVKEEHQKVLDRIKSLTTAQTKYEQERFEFTHLLLNDKKQLPKFTLEELGKHNQRIAASIDIDKDTAQNELEPMPLQKINRARLLAKNVTFLAEREMSIERLTKRLQSILHKKISPDVVKAFATACFDHLVHPTGELRKKNELSEEQKTALNEAYGQLVVSQLRSTAQAESSKELMAHFQQFWKELTEEDFVQLGKEVGRIGYFLNNQGDDKDCKSLNLEKVTSQLKEKIQPAEQRSSYACEQFVRTFHEAWTTDKSLKSLRWDFDDKSSPIALLLREKAH